MKKHILFITMLLTVGGVNAQFIGVQPDNPTENSPIFIQTAEGCASTVLVGYNINAPVVNVNIDYTPCSIGVPPPSATVNNPIGQLPAGDYEFIFNITDLFSMTESQQSIFVTVGPAPEPISVPLNTSLLIFLVLGFSFFRFKNNYN